MNSTDNSNLNSAPEELALILHGVFNNFYIVKKMNEFLQNCQSIGEGEPPTSLEFHDSNRFVHAEKSLEDGCLILQTTDGSKFNIQITKV